MFVEWHPINAYTSLQWACDDAAVQMPVYTSVCLCCSPPVALVAMGSSSPVRCLIPVCAAIVQVVRCALENAASVARTFLMSDVVSPSACPTADLIPAVPPPQRRRRLMSSTLTGAAAAVLRWLRSLDPARSAGQAHSKHPTLMWSN